MTYRIEDDYPLLSGAIDFLCQAEAWESWLEAWNSWHNVMSSVRPDARFNVLRVCKVPWPNEVRRIWYLDVAISGQETVKVNLNTYHQERYFALARARRDCKASAIKRIKQAEIEVLVRDKSRTDSHWHILTADRISNIKAIYFNNPTIRYGDKYYEYRLRDVVGVPLSQAIFIYGDLGQVKRLIDLIKFGAPDRLGKCSESPYVTKWCAEDFDNKRQEFLELQAGLFAQILRQLRAGDLVGTQSGALVSIDDWGVADQSLPPAEWRPGVLIRSPIAADFAGVPALVDQPAKKGAPLKNDEAIWLEIEAEIDAKIPRSRAINSRLDRIEGANDAAKRRTAQRTLKQRKDARRADCEKTK